MNRRTITRRKLYQRIAPVALVGMLGLAAAACGSSGGTRTNNITPGQSPSTSPATSPPTTSGSSGNGGAGF